MPVHAPSCAETGAASSTSDHHHALYIETVPLENARTTGMNLIDSYNVPRISASRFCLIYVLLFNGSIIW